jgi:cytosine/adenosine deaminase-related metal-dependent hydrolase
MHNPLSAVVYGAQAADVRYVLVDGQLLVDRGQLTPRTGLDLERLRALAGERVPPLLRRAGLA